MTKQNQAEIEAEVLLYNLGYEEDLKLKYAIAEALRKRDEMVIEACAKIAERGADEGPVYCEEPACVAAAIRALKEQLK